MPFFKKFLSFLLSVALIASFSNFAGTILAPQPAHATGEKMVLLWDTALGGSVPTGWTNASATYGNYFLRGDTIANVGLSLSPTHIHTVGTVAFVAASTPAVDAKSNKTDVPLANAPHGHSITLFTMTPTTILPVYRDLIAITCNAGIPTTLPQYAIAIFDSAVGETGFTDYASQNTYMIRIAATSGGTGGSTTHTHADLQITSGTASASTSCTAGTGVTAVTNTHTHTYGPLTSPASTAHTPLHTEVDLRYVTNSGGTAIPVGMIAMFNGDPNIDSSGWNVISDGGEAFGGVYIEAQTVYATGKGTATHNHALSVTSSTWTAATIVASGPPTSSMISTHSHTISGNFSTENNTPPYINVVVAKKLAPFTPKSQDWRWYDAENVADPANTNGSETSAGDSLAGENSSPTSTRIIYKGNAFKLRLKIAETAGNGQNDIRFRLQFDTSNSFPAPVYVAEQGATGLTDTWRYYNGAGDDDVIISNVRLSGSPSAGTRNETGTSASTFDFIASTTYEFEFTIQLNPAMPVDPPNSQIYYFRAYDTVNSNPVPTDNGETYPSLTTAAAYNLELIAPSQVNFPDFQLGEAPEQNFDWGATYRISVWAKSDYAPSWTLTVTATNMDRQGGGDTIPNTDQYWTTETLYYAWASDTSNLLTNNGYLNNNIATITGSGGGGFFIEPLYTIYNINSRLVGTYTGTVTLTLA